MQLMKYALIKKNNQKTKKTDITIILLIFKLPQDSFLLLRRCSFIQVRSLPFGGAAMKRRLPPITNEGRTFLSHGDGPRTSSLIP